MHRRRYARTGSMFWFRLNTFIGSYRDLSCPKRRYLDSPYAPRATPVYRNELLPHAMPPKDLVPTTNP